MTLPTVWFHASEQLGSTLLQVFFQSGSTTEVEVNGSATPNADKATGIATLTQGSTLRVTFQSWANERASTKTAKSPEQ